MCGGAKLNSILAVCVHCPVNERWHQPFGTFHDIMSPSSSAPNMTALAKPGFVHPSPCSMAQSDLEPRHHTRIHNLSDIYYALKQYSKPGILSPDETSRVILIILEILTDGVDKDALLFSSRFMTKDDYDDVVVERNIIHHCGFPLCNNDPRGIRQLHQINYRRPSMILPSTYLSKYCCREHHQASLFFQAQLSEIPVYSRKDITYVPFGQSFESSIALLEDVESKARAENKSLTQVIQEFAQMSLANAAQNNTPSFGQPDAAAKTPATTAADLTATLESLTLVERDPTVPQLDAAGQDEPIDVHAPPSAIEGYVSTFRTS